MSNMLDLCVLETKFGKAENRADLNTEIFLGMKMNF